MSSPSSASWAPKRPQKVPSFPNRHCPFSVSFSKPQKPRKLRFSALQDDRESENSSVAVVDEKIKDEETQKSEDEKGGSEEKEKQQEVDWKTDEEFKKFMGNPSIEAAIKLEKKRTEQRLKELDVESSSNNPIVGFFSRIVRDNLKKEKERLEKAEETFKALDLNKVCLICVSCFSDWG